jgi:hypothetical protein
MDYPALSTASPYTTANSVHSQIPRVLITAPLTASMSAISFAWRRFESRFRYERTFAHKVLQIFHAARIFKLIA